MNSGRRGLLRFAFSFLATVLVAAAVTGSAGAAVYWGDNGTIGAANLDGSGANPRYFKPPFPADSSGPLCGVAVSPNYLYWAGAFGLGRVNFDGPAGPQTIVSHLQGPCGIAVDDGHVYWAEAKTGSIGRANLDGSEATGSFVTGIDHPCGLAVDAGHLYWMGWRGIGRANLDGTAVEPEFLPLIPTGCGLAAEGSHLYWGEHGAIGRANLDGSEPKPGFVTGIGGVESIALDAAHVYWTDRPEGMAYSSVGRANIDGSGAERSWIGADQFYLGGIAVDSRPAPVPLPLPSRSFHFGEIRHQWRTGSVVIDVWVPASGELTLRAPKLGWKVLKGAPPPPYVEGGFRWRLKIWPGKTSFGRKVRAEMQRRGRAKVALYVSYAETGQLAFEGAKMVALINHRPARH
jgi:low-density lipoprotein receptor class B